MRLLIFLMILLSSAFTYAADSSSVGLSTLTSKSPFVLFTEDYLSFSADATESGCNGAGSSLAASYKPRAIPGKDTLNCPPNYGYMEMVHLNHVSNISANCYFVDMGSRVTRQSISPTAAWILSGFVRYQCAGSPTYYCLPAMVTVTVFCVPN